MPMTHFGHYVRRRVELVPRDTDEPLDWFSGNQVNVLAMERPIRHVTHSMDHVAKMIKVGDVIWVFSQLRSKWGSLPPSLDCKIVIAEKTPRKDTIGFDFVASEESCYFPLLDARVLLSQLKIQTRTRNSVPLLGVNAGNNCGQALRSPRLFANAELMQAHAALIQKLPMDIISYRHKDGTKSAFLAARELMLQENPSSIFLDRWCLPRGLAERRNNDEYRFYLWPYIAKVIAQARRVVTINSPAYAEDGSFSKLEYEEARRLEKLAWK